MTRSDILIKKIALDDMTCKEKDLLIVTLCDKIENVYNNVLFPIENDGKFMPLAEVLRKALER